jgi:hypothetical protein
MHMSKFLCTFETCFIHSNQKDFKSFDTLDVCGDSKYGPKYLP